MAIPRHDDEDGLANSLPKIHCAFLRIPPKKFTPGLDKPSHPEGSGWRGEEGKPLFRDFITFGKSGDRRTREKTQKPLSPTHRHFYYTVRFEASAEEKEFASFCLLFSFPGKTQFLHQNAQAGKAKLRNDTR